MKAVKHFLLFCLTIGQSSIITAKTLELLNKLDIPIDVAIGTRNNPPTISSKTTQVMPGQSYKQSVDNTQFPQLLFKDPKAPEIAFVYEFRDKTDAKKALSTNMYVRVLEKKGLFEKEGRISFEPQQFVMANLDKDNIFLVKTLGAPAPAPKPEEVTAHMILGLKKNASDAEILGLKKTELNDKTAAQKAYAALSAIWNPEKNNDNTVMQKRNTNKTFKDLPKKRQNEIAAETFKLITDAYGRTMGQSLAIIGKTFEFTNDLDVPVQVAFGTRQNQPTMKSVFSEIKPGKLYTRSIDATHVPQLLLLDSKAPEVGFLYEFRDKKDSSKPVNTNIYVHLLDVGGKISFERRQDTFDNLDNENIFLIKTLGTPASKVTAYTILGLQEGASDAEILGLKKAELNDKAAAQKAYFKLLAIWHPDKNKDEETLALRNTNATFKNLSKKRQDEITTEVFKLIADAYSRITKAKK